MRKSSNSGKKALFIQRLGAFLIDMLLIVFFASLISTPFVDSAKQKKLQKQAMNVVDKMQKSEITVDQYIDEYSSVFYKLARTTGIVSLITFFLDVLYFVVFQVYNGGQTLGKKMMKIKVVSDNGELTTDQMIIRSLISNFILIDMISFVFMLFVSKSNYFYCVGVLESIKYLIVFISIIMIMKRKDGCALHDLVAHTKVVRV